MTRHPRFRVPVSSPVLAFGLALTLAAAGRASAQADVHIDQTDLHIELGSDVDHATNPPRGRYRARFAFQLAGADVKQGDAVRVEWFRGRQVAAQVRCPVVLSYDQTPRRTRCETDPTLDHAGAVRVRMTYIDGTTDQETPIHDAVLQVIETRQWVRNEGRRAIHVRSWQVSGDDRLGFAFVKQLEIYDGPGRLAFHFWTAHAEAEIPRGQWSFRCRQDGGAWSGHRVASVVRNAQPSLHVQNRVSRRGDVVVEDLYWSRYLATVENIPLSVASSGVVAPDHASAGRWACQLRRDGVVVRAFRMNVNDQGQILPHAVQTAERGLRLNDRSAVVDVFFPEASTLGPSFDPARIRSSFGLGLPWPSADAMAEELDALPRLRSEVRFTGQRGRRRS